MAKKTASKKQLTEQEAAVKELWQIPKRAYQRLFDLHVDLKPDASSRIDKMMEGNGRGQTTGPDGLNAVSWINWANKRKAGAVGYLFPGSQVHNSSGYLKPGAKPHGYAVLTRDGQTFHEAVVEGHKSVILYSF